MTVLQKIIEDFKSLGDIDNLSGMEVAAALKKRLPADEQQIREAFEAGEYYNSKREFAEPPPDFKTYITNLKK